MKKVALALAVATLASGAFAGTIEMPVMEPTVVVEQIQEPAGSSAGGLVPALIVLGVIAAAVACCK